METISILESRVQEKLFLSLLQEPSNKTCMDCGALSPQYANLSHNTFVCTSCSSILCNFGFRIKNVRVSSFSKEEIQSIRETGGNAGARMVYLAKLQNCTHPHQGNVLEMRKIIHQRYVQRLWYKKLRRQSCPPSVDQEKSIDTTIAAPPLSSVRQRTTNRRNSVQTANPASSPQYSASSSGFGSPSSSTASPQQLAPAQQQQGIHNQNAQSVVMSRGSQYISRAAQRSTNPFDPPMGNQQTTLTPAKFPVQQPAPPSYQPITSPVFTPATSGFTATPLGANAMNGMPTVSLDDDPFANIPIPLTRKERHPADPEYNVPANMTTRLEQQRLLQMQQQQYFQNQVMYRG